MDILHVNSASLIEPYTLDVDHAYAATLGKTVRISSRAVYMYKLHDDRAFAGMRRRVIFNAFKPNYMRCLMKLLTRLQDTKIPTCRQGVDSQICPFGVSLPYVHVWLGRDWDT